LNIDEMQAGREMDALIAEKVMGLILDSDNPFMANIVVFEANTGENTGHTQNLPHYSTEMAAAWEVAEKMPMPLELAKSYEKVYNVGPRGWQVCWCPNEMSQCEGCNDDCRCTSGNDVWAESAPLAICRAALKILGVNA